MLTQQRVNELVKLAKELRCEELQVLVGAFTLGCAQEITIDYLNDDIDGWEDQNVYPGCDLWEQGSFMLEDLTNEREVAAVINKYNLTPHYDIIIEKKWTARKK